MLVKVGSVEYELTYKNVKNINLRIKSDGTVNVSANRWTSRNTIDDFVLSKSDFIQNALQKYRADSKTEPLFTEQQLKSLVLGLCQKAYPYFEIRGVSYPQIKFKNMVSRWGELSYFQGNNNLQYKS